VGDPERFVRACEGHGRQRLLQKLIHSPEAVSRPLLQTGLELAAHLRLTEIGDDLSARRTAFASEMRAILQRIDVVEASSLGAFRRLLTETTRSENT
jgi:glycerol-3-phosphate O-acyltransferase